MRISDRRRSSNFEFIILVGKRVAATTYLYPTNALALSAAASFQFRITI